MSIHPPIPNPQDAVATPAAAEPRLVVLINTVLPIWCRHIVSIRRHSELAVTDMLQACGQLQTQAEKHPALLESVDQLLQAFQYQDRLSQRMSLLEDDITRLIQVLSDKDQPIPEVDAWLLRLESQYAMQEQAQDHHGQAPQNKAHSAGQEAQFF
nr:hypothetical protein [uncultured Rhodoferax sp.]